MKPFFRILRYILRYKTLVLLAVFCSIMYAAMNAFSAYLIGPFMETLFSGGEILSEKITVITEDTGRLEQIRYSFQAAMNNLLGRGNPQDVLSRLCQIIIVVILIKNVFSYIQGYIMAYVEQGVVRDLRGDVYSSYHRLPIRYFQKRKTGDLISRVINDCHTINTNLNSSLINLMKEPINIFVILVFMIILSPKLTVTTFLIAPPCLFIISKISKKNL